MSDSETADAPSDETISRALRDVVIAIHKTGNTQDLTVKRVRARAEEELGLPSGFLKNQDWKTKSNDLIHEAVDTYCTDEPAPEPKAAPLKKAPKPKPQPKPKPEHKKKVKPANENTRRVKRKAAAPAKQPQKRRKTVSSDEDLAPSFSDASDEISDLSDAEKKVPKNPARRQQRVVAEDSDEEDEPNMRNVAKGEDSEAEASVRAVRAEPKQTPPPGDKAVPSDSDMSSLIDESPVKKRRKKSPPPAKRGKQPKAKEPMARKGNSKSKAGEDPDQAEIKRLQGWLVKCGIRKVWGKELAKCDTSKEKLSHLKGMLRDAGMDGKYSVEKAAKIKEKREFATDLEAIRAGEAAWGKKEVTDAGRPRRGAAAKPAPKPVVFSDDDEDEDESQDNKGDSTDVSDDFVDDDVKAESEDENGQEESEDDNADDYEGDHSD